MKFARTLALITGAALLFTACSRESDEASVSVEANTNPLLAHVPAGTAYVFAALESTPEEIVDVYLARFQPVLDVMTKEIGNFQTDYAAGEYENNQMAQLAMAVLDELGGELSVDSLSKLGINMQAHHVTYGMGVFPVIRLGLDDSKALRDAIGRIEAEMGFEMPEKDLNGTSYWSVSEDDTPVGIYVAILDQQLAIAAFPASSEDQLLAAFLGQEMPQQSLDTTNALAIMNAEKGYTGYGSGYVDLQQIADEILDADSDTHTFLGPDMGFDLNSLDPVCVAEYKSMVAKAPRMTAGTTVLTANELAARYELEFEDTLAGQLVELVSAVPVAEESENLFSASIAVKVGKLRSYVLEKANALVESPYQCEELQELNQNAAELAAQLGIPMPPMVNNLMGVRVSVDDLDIDIDDDMPIVDGLLAVHVDKPEMFVGTATMLVPGFEDLDLANQSDPVRIPTELMQVKIDDFEIYALMSKDAIGIAVGGQHAPLLADYLEAEPQQDGTFFSLSYDMARQLEIQTAMQQKYDVDPDHPHGFSDEFSDAFMSSYKAMLGRSRVDMRLTADGLVIDSSMTFK